MESKTKTVHKPTVLQKVSKKLLLIMIYYMSCLKRKGSTVGCSFHPAFSFFPWLFPQTRLFCLYDLQMRDEMIFKVVEGERESKTWRSAPCLTLSYQRKNEVIDFLSVSLSAGNIKTDSEVPPSQLSSSSPPLFLPDLHLSVDSACHSILSPYV